MERDGTPQSFKGGDDGPNPWTGTSSHIGSTQTHRASPGHHFENTSAAGNARAHLGDQYHYHGGQHNHYHKPTTAISSAHGATANQLLKSLFFPRMDFRYAAIQAAYRQTCQWLFENMRDGAIRSSGRLIMAYCGSRESLARASQPSRKLHYSMHGRCISMKGAFTSFSTAEAIVWKSQWRVCFARFCIKLCLIRLKYRGFWRP
jgi:hypothetical protein